jgi:hypothetical protein
VTFDASMSMIGLHPKNPFSRVVLFLVAFGSTVQRLREVGVLVEWVFDQAKYLGHLLGSVEASDIEEFIISIIIHVMEDEGGW